MGARYLDRVDDRRPLELEPLDLVGQRAVALGQHRHLVARHRLTLYLLPKPAPAPPVWRRILGRIVEENQSFEAE